MADKHAKSNYTTDRNIPGAFEGETVTRRRFMTGTAHSVGGIAAAAFVLPTIGFAFGPVFASGHARWETVGFPDDFPDNNYVPKVITITPDIGETGKTTVYLRKRNPAIDGGSGDAHSQYIAISTRCAHLGCPVRWVPASERFICPCHGGVYDLLGKRTGGPPPRSLDRFPTRVLNGMVQVSTQRYSVNSELRAFSPRDPGEPLDGIGQYMYPSRPTARKL